MAVDINDADIIFLLPSRRHIKSERRGVTDDSYSVHLHLWKKVKAQKVRSQIVAECVGLYTAQVTCPPPYSLPPSL